VVYLIRSKDWNRTKFERFIVHDPRQAVRKAKKHAIFEKWLSFNNNK
jgi:hypothetical protein